LFSWRKIDVDVPSVQTLAGICLLAFGCQEAGVTKFNNNPEATIRTPTGGAELARGELFSASGIVNDDDHATQDLVASWFVDGDLICEEVVTSDGGTACDIEVASVEATITLEVKDPMGAVGSATVDVTTINNHRPVIALEKPTAGGVYYRDQKVQLLGTISDAEDKAENISLTAVGDINGEWEVTVMEDGTFVGSMFLDDVEHTLTLRAEDTHGGVATEVVFIQVGGPNTAPSCDIVSPESGSAADFRTSIDLAGQVTDLDVGSEMLSVTWVSSLDGVLSTEPPDPAGGSYVFLDAGDLQIGTHVITLQGEDEVGATCSDVLLLTVGEPPEVWIEQPEEGAVYGQGVPLTIRATVSDTEDSPTDIGFVWQTTDDGVFSSQGADSTGVVEFAVDTLSPGHKAMTVTATDVGGLFTTELVNFTINNMASAPEVQIITTEGADCVDTEVRTGDEMRACIVAHSVDPDGDLITYAYAWYRDGVLLEGAEDLSTPASETTRGELWRVEVTPWDSLGAGAVGLDTVSIQNTPPLLEDVFIDPDPAGTGDELTCELGLTIEPDGDSTTYSYTWSVNDISTAATTATLSSDHFDKGDSVACTVTPTDGIDVGLSTTSWPLLIANTAPSVDGVSIAPELVSTGDVLTCAYTGFSDPDGSDVPDLSTYEWFLNGISVGEGVAYVGDFIGGDILTCEVTPFDGETPGSVVSASVTVENTSPLISGVSIIPTTPHADDTVNCSWSGWYDADDDADMSVATWLVNGDEVGTGTTLAGMFSGGDVVSCRVIAFDGTAEGTELSTSVIVLNTAPSADTAVISPDPATVLSSLSCAATGYTDLDPGDADLSMYQWWVDGVEAGTASTLDSGFIGGQTVTCEITPHDGTASGSPVTTELYITNTLPTVGWAILGPTPARADTPLNCAWADPVDADGHSLVVTAEWTIDGEFAGSGSSLSSGYGAGDAVVCNVFAHDGLDPGPVVSDSVVITNTLPTIDAVSIQPDPAQAADTLRCEWTGYTDIDGDPDASIATWAINGLFAGVGPELYGGFHGGQVVTCTVIPSDGRDSGDAMFATIVISNSAPTVDSVSILPPDATVGTDLSCVYAGFDDVDSDGDFSTLRWTINGVDAGTGSTLSGGFVGLDTVECEVTPYDGTDAGVPVVGTLAVVNTAPIVTTVTIDPPAPITGDTVTCSWSGYSDLDGHGDASSASWFINDVLATDGTVIAGGFTSGDELRCTVTPNDGDMDGLPVSLSADIQNSAPSIETVTVFPITATATTGLTCSWAGYLDLEGEADVSLVEWTVNGEVVGSGPSLASGYVHDDVVSCEVTPYDGVDEGTPQSGSTVVGNTAPSVSSASITPSLAYRTNDLTCAWEGYFDLDGEVDQSIVTWIVDGVSTHTGPTLPGDSTEENDIVRCEVRAYDGTDEGNLVTSYLVIQESIPQIESLSIIPDPAFRDSVLVCNWEGFTDADSDPDLTTVQWTMGSTVVGTERELEGMFFPADTVACAATPYDGTHTGTTLYASIVIGNAPPVVTSASLTPDPVYTNDTMTCAEGYTYDADGTTTFLYEYKWFVNGVELGSETSDTLSPAFFDKDDGVQCAVAANDGLDTGGYTVSNLVSVLNTEPVVNSVTIGPEGAKTNDNLVAIVDSGDLDDDSVTLSYDWYVNGVLLVTLPTLNGAIYFDKGDQVQVEVTPFDGEDAGAPLASPIVTIENTPPTSPSASISPVDPVSGLDDIVCSLTGLGTDADGDLMTYAWGWEVDGEEWSGPATTTVESDDTILSGSLNSYETWTCNIYAIDDEEAGLPGTVDIEVLSVFAGWPTADVGLNDAYLKVNGEDNKDYSGRTVAWVGDTDGDGTTDFLVAAPDNDDVYTTGGKVYLIRSADVPGVSSVPLNDAAIAWTGTGPGHNLGGYVQSKALGPAGDIDGDGLDDILIGEPLYASSAGTLDGRVYLVKGASISATGPVTIPSIDTADIIFHGPVYGQLGHAVANLGEVNGGGLPDLLFGAPNASGGKGVAYLFYGENLGSATDLYVGLDADVQFTAEAPGDELALRVATAGDVDADGLNDVLIAAPSNDVGGESRSGRVYLMLATSITAAVHSASADADWLFNGTNSNDLAGHAIAGAGDIDKDGYAEFMIAAKGQDSFGSNSGMVYVLNGGDLPIFRTFALADAWYKLGGELAGDRAGHDISNAGDVDTDGRNDILISAYANDAGGPSAGRTYLVLAADLDDAGGSMSLSSASYSFTGEASADSSGYSISGGGDWDGDGLSDFLIGAYLHDAAYADVGTTYLFRAPSIYH
jgi:hypothetical protein